ncbi:MAG: asparagine synthase C-terminal domain-containing protein [candidate division KSB1 bacterium]|nr:asparagine synthase C-terminal domain-containing protein [candidate division KSB1 bacterium]MDZ7368532.1 asparagine synthase C-terminal domain-containing protein [candidate division KSB1 bacterium]MDZ7406240.1 asparagine synthase C-terminal domain-containing protein [candidate division KSB1 bacterium]
MANAKAVGKYFLDQNEIDPRLNVLTANEIAVGLLPVGVQTLDANSSVYEHKPSNSFAVLLGGVFNRAELVVQHLGNDVKAASDAEVAWRTYEKIGVKAFRELNGNFVIAIWDAPKQCFYLVRDHLGIEPVYYCRKDGVLYFSSRLQRLTRVPQVGRQLNFGVLQRYLLFNYNPGYDTLFENIHSLRPGCFIKIENNRFTIEPYWRISFAEPFEKDEATYKQELLELMRDAVRLRLAGGKFRPGAFLSGGMDSSSVVHFMHGLLQAPIATYSFRCFGKTYDESHYARVMSEHYQTRHHEIPFPAEETRLIAKIAQQAQEPFSDIGIEVASFLLGSRVREEADYVLTGDGGDELFGGHPVYLADRAAEMFGKIPGFIRQPLTHALQLLPDTDAKKSLPVKAKRFSYSCKFPASLYSNRWRIYYTPEELQKLCAPDLRQRVNGFDPCRELVEIYQEADGKDHLSITLYGDYYSVVNFYLRRLELIRHFGVEGRMPLLDHRLVEYTARIPSHLKIGKKGETKIILHKIMHGELPDEIVFRKDKLGHSVPMKNWMRESVAVQTLLKEFLSTETVRRRGLFDPAVISRMMNEHQRKSHNHSHRLWALLVFELWCRAHLGN